MDEKALFTLDGLRRFHDWTHACLTLLLDHLAKIPAEDYTKEVPGFGSPSIRHQVVHIFNCEGAWVHVLQGLPVRDRPAGDCPTVTEARALQQEVRRQTEVYLADLTEQQLNSDRELHFTDGDVAVRTPALVLHHVFTHAFHHKGQVVAMCRLLGYPAPDTDLSQFE